MVLSKRTEKLLRKVASRLWMAANRIAVNRAIKVLESL